MQPVAIRGDIVLGGDQLVLLAGPCVIESAAHTLAMAAAIAAVAAELALPYVFKSSFDKANRSSLASYRGPGLAAGLDILRRVKDELGLAVTTDVHEPGQCAAVAQVVDLLQIPAFLCRQTDLLVAAAETGKPVSVKKGQFMAPGDMAQAIAKLTGAGAAGVVLMERGSSFGYHNLVVDMRGLMTMRELGWPVVFDGTHSVQLPAAAGECSGGERQFIPPLCRAAAAVGIEGLFLEVHDDPDQALCDGPNQWPLAELKGLLETVLRIREAAKPRRARRRRVPQPASPE
jgi:2-dehydro-3-deoxyphosphooctonate aldolase (KDO 8-P synthase)